MRGHGGLGPARVDRAVQGSVPRRDAQRARVGPDQRDEHGRDPRRRPVEQVVETRGGPAEFAVPFGSVADHGIRGVDDLVEQYAPAGRRSGTRRLARPRRPTGFPPRFRWPRGTRPPRPSAATSRPTIIETARRPLVERDAQPARDRADMLHEALLAPAARRQGRPSHTGPPGNSRDHDPQQNRPEPQRHDRGDPPSPSGARPR